MKQKSYKPDKSCTINGLGIFMQDLIDSLSYIKCQTSGYHLWNYVILLATFVFKPGLSLPCRQFKA